MADYNNAKRYDYDTQDLREWNKIRHKIEDPKWQNHYLIKPKKKSYTQHSQINLGKHEKHDWQPLKGPVGLHAGKVICNTCGGKWVAWLPKGTI